MIISKKKYQEAIAKAVREAVDRVDEREWVRSRIDCLDREMDSRCEGIMRHVMQLEERLEALDHAKERRLRRWMK